MGDKYSSQERLYQDLQKYTVNKKAVFGDTCERCGKEFTFTGADVKDRAFVCPYCGYSMPFFRCNYE